MRQTRVYLLDKGRELDLKHHENIMEFERIMLSGIDKTEEETLLRCLKKIRDNILESNETSERTSDGI